MFNSLIENFNSSSSDLLNNGDMFNRDIVGRKMFCFQFDPGAKRQFMHSQYKEITSDEKHEYISRSTDSYMWASSIIRVESIINSQLRDIHSINNSMRKC